MQDKGIEVRSVGPHDGPEFVVDAGLRKEVGVGKRLKDGAMQLVREIDIARASIAEADPQVLFFRPGDSVPLQAWYDIWYQMKGDGSGYHG
ncbi:MAG: hypothetical protein JWN10_731 [Solirubrobacterales bacterium]|nr:hypothetical protein [Solirubrobacterales bacterium]